MKLRLHYSCGHEAASAAKKLRDDGHDAIKLHMFCAVDVRVQPDRMIYADPPPLSIEARS